MLIFIALSVLGSSLWPPKFRPIEAHLHSYHLWAWGKQFIKKTLDQFVDTGAYPGFWRGFTGGRVGWGWGGGGGADKLNYSYIFLGQILINSIQILTVPASDMPWGASNINHTGTLTAPKHGAHRNTDTAGPKGQLVYFQKQAARLWGDRRKFFVTKLLQDGWKCPNAILLDRYR